MEKLVGRQVTFHLDHDLIEPLRRKAAKREQSQRVIINRALRRELHRELRREIEKLTEGRNS